MKQREKDLKEGREGERSGRMRAPQRSGQAKTMPTWGCWQLTDTALFFQQHSQEEKISSQVLLLEQAIISTITVWALEK